MRSGTATAHLALGGGQLPEEKAASGMVWQQGEENTPTCDFRVNKMLLSLRASGLLEPAMLKPFVCIEEECGNY